MIVGYSLQLNQLNTLYLAPPTQFIVFEQLKEQACLNINVVAIWQRGDPLTNAYSTAAAANFIVGGAPWYDVIADHMTANLTFDLEIQVKLTRERFKVIFLKE